MVNSELFTPFKIGPIELRNRTIRSAAFEAMCPGQRPSKELFDYHTAVARGGIGMTTVSNFASLSSLMSISGASQPIHVAPAVESIAKIHCPALRKFAG